MIKVSLSLKILLSPQCHTMGAALFWALLQPLLELRDWLARDEFMLHCIPLIMILLLCGHEQVLQKNTFDGGEEEEGT